MKSRVLNKREKTKIIYFCNRTLDIFWEFDNNIKLARYLLEGRWSGFISGVNRDAFNPPEWEIVSKDFIKQKFPHAFI